MTKKQTNTIKKIYLINYTQIISFLILTFFGFLGSLIGIIIYERTEDKVLFAFLLVLSLFFLLVCLWYASRKRIASEDN